MLKKCFKGLVLLTTASLLSLVLTQAQAAKKISLADLESELEVTFPDALKTELTPVLKSYNKQKSPKALAYAGNGSGHFAVGISVKARSHFAAAQAATHACEEYRTNNNIVSSCEIVLLDNAVIKLGRQYKIGLTEKTPSSVWRISDLSSRKSIYLAGTIHLLKPTLLPLPAVYGQIFNKADRIALENNPLLASDPQRNAQILAITTPDKNEIKAAMSKGTRKKLKKIFRTLGIPKKTIFNAYPMMLQFNLGTVGYNSLGFNAANGIELSYARQASRLGKAVLEVEQFAEVVKSLVSLPMHVQMKYLDASLQGNEEGHKNLEQMITHWLRGEIHQMYSLARKESDGDSVLSEIADYIYDERNIGMLEHIESYLTQPETTTVMVGALHLGGPKGLVNLLTEKGYLVQQLNHSGGPL